MVLPTPSGNFSQNVSPTSARRARLADIVQKSIPTLQDDEGNEPKRPHGTLRRTTSVGPNMIRQQHLSPSVGSPKSPDSGSPRIPKGKQQREKPSRLLCMATEAMDLQMLCLQQDEGERDSFLTCKLEADATQVIKGYLHNAKVFCPCYLGKTAQQYIKPQATLGFRYADGELRLVALGITVPRAML